MDSLTPPENALSRHISGPRSLRPRENRSHPPRYIPPVHHTGPVIPLEFPPVAPASSYAPPYTRDVHADSEAGVAYSEMESSGYNPTSTRRNFVGGLIGGIRKIPQGLAKHHSRESLYAEYAEAEAARLTAAQRLYHPESVGLSDIPEQALSEDLDSNPTQYDDGTTFVNHEMPAPVPIPILRSPGMYTDSRLTSEYSKESSNEPLPPDDTWAYYIRRIQIFIHDIRKLPWSTPRIVHDYIPSQDGRGRYGESKPAISWYTPSNRLHQEKINFPPPNVHVVPPTPTSYITSGYGVAPLPSHISAFPSPYSEGAATAIRPSRTPMTATSAGMGFPSPGLSSHGNGRQVQTYSWYMSSPQQYPPPNFQSDASTPRTGLGFEGHFRSP